MVTRIILCLLAAAVAATAVTDAQAQRKRKFCLAIYSHDFSGKNASPINYEHRWCDADGSDCTKWKLNTLTDNGQAYRVKTQCVTWTTPQVMQVRFDGDFRPDYQETSKRLKAEPFPFRQKLIPSSGCVGKANYHFVSRTDDRRLVINNGRPRDVIVKKCTWGSPD
jgi:hypothetical protein